MLSEHIVKGNDIKLLTDFDPDKEEEKNSYKLLKDVNKASKDVQNGLKKLSVDDTRILIEKYSIKDE